MKELLKKGDGFLTAALIVIAIITIIIALKGTSGLKALILAHDTLV